ncbi:MAG: ABC transporter transmembrane domain-containing protein [Proteobacteria bacterium]|nr:ABC transporter transmembrane domain-containing protein [Pseudomonadota bacterium]
MTKAAPKFDILRGHRAELIAASSAINILSLALPITILQVYDRVIPNNSNQTLAIFVVALGFILILDMILSLGRAYISNWTAARVQHRMACDAVGHIFKSDLRAFDASPPGVHIQRLRAIDSVKSHFAGQSLLLIVDLPFALLFFLLIGLIAGPLAVVPVIVLILLGMTAAIAGRRVSAALKLRRETDDRRYNFIIEVLKTIHTIKGLGMEAMMVRRYERLQASSAEASYLFADASTWSRNTGQVFSQLTAIAVGAYGSTMVIDGALTIGALAACTLLASRSAQPMMRAVATWTQFQNARVTRNQVDDLMQLPLESKPEAPALHRIAGNVVLKDVTFSYTQQENALFQNVNLHFNAGETIAVSGPNGSGKSTLLGLIMGLHVPSAGQVLIDGQNIWEHDAVSLRSQVVYLPQQPVLFQGSLMDNLTMFRGDSHIDDALIMAEKLGLHEAVGRMPHGYETRVEHAANDGLPGGVRQRIALIRALTLVENPQLILFDEANTFLDQDSDTRLLELLKYYRGKSALVIVSHRPSFLELADTRYVIRDHGVHKAPEDARGSIDRIQREFA